jgi:hypothetical protein
LLDSSATLTARSTATGASLTAVIVTVTAAVLEVAVPSLARKVNESAPW